MELIATTRPEAVAYAYGASLDEEGRTLDCGLLMVHHDNKRREITFRNPATKQRIRVRLPAEAIGNNGHLFFLNEPLEVV